MSDHQSEFTESNLGVPQHSILEPLLFALYINDLDENLPLSRSVFYADSTTLLLVAQGRIYNRESVSLPSLKNWLLCNNTDKIVYIRFLRLLKFRWIILKLKMVLPYSFWASLLIVHCLHVSDLCKRLSRICFALRTTARDDDDGVLRSVSSVLS